jgi:hypothetical protein
MFALVLVPWISGARTPDIPSILQGSWLCKGKAINSSAKFSRSYIRVNGSAKDGFEAVVYATKESTDVLDQFHIVVSDKTAVRFGRSPDALQPLNFTASLDQFYTASGTWEGSAFSAMIARSTIVTVTIVSEAAHTTLYFAKDIDRTPPPWYKKYLSYGVLGVLFIAMQLLPLWSRRNHPPGPPAPRPRPRESPSPSPGPKVEEAIDVKTAPEVSDEAQADAVPPDEEKANED